MTDGPVVPGVGAPRAFGVQVGSGNLQINVYYDERTWTRQPVTPPLAGSPYRGLNAFESADAGLFFGRDEAVRDVLDRMARRIDRPGLLAVSGVSGAGKSSLLRAGVLPRLRADGLAGLSDAAHWPCLLFTPGQAPLDELAIQVALLAELDAGTVRQSLEAFPAGFALIARQAALKQNSSAAGGSQERLLLIIDQFEQLFSLCPDEGQRRAFVAALDAAATISQGADGTPSAMVVLAVRADFESRCTDYEELTSAIQDRYLLTAMTKRQLQQAITMPAAKAGSSVDKDLVETLVAEISMRSSAGAAGPVAGQGVLPLLSHALDQSWRGRDRRNGESLTLADYMNTGGIEKAIARSAQEAYDTLSPARQETARRVFVQLTAISPDGADTPIPVAKADLAHSVPGGQSADDTNRDLTAVLEAFASARLLTLAADTVEITHEVLLSAWPLLRDTWLAENRADRIVRTGLRTAAAEWESRDRDPAYLYTGSLLAAAVETAARAAADPARFPPLPPKAAAFLTASRRASWRRTRRRQSLVALLAALTVALAVSMVVAFGQRNTAEDEHNQAITARDVAAANSLVVRSEATGASDPSLARLEAVAAWRLDPDASTEYAMLSAAALPWDTVYGSGDGSTVTSVAVSLDGRLVADGTDDGMTQVWDSATHSVVARLATPGSIVALAFSTNAELLAAAADNDTVQVWSVATHRLLASFAGPPYAGINSVAFSPDGRQLAVGTSTTLSDQGTVQLWNASQWETPSTRTAAITLRTGNFANVDAVAFSPDGTQLAVGTESGGDGTTQLWNVAADRMTGTLQVGSGTGVSALAFAPDGTLLAADTETGVQLWDTATRKLTATLATGTNAIDSATGTGTGELTFGADGQTLAVTVAGGGNNSVSSSTLQLWNVSARMRTATLPVGDVNVAAQGAGTVTPVPVAAAQGSDLLAVGADGSVQLLDSVISAPLATLPVGSGNEVQAVAFSPDDRLLAVGTNGMVQLWDTATRTLAATLPTGGSDIAFSPDGKLLAAADANTVQLWNVATRTLTAVLRTGQQALPVDAVAFSPDGKYLAGGSGYPGPPAMGHPAGSAGNERGTVFVWSVATRELTAAFPSSAAGVLSVAFSPDGKSLVASTTEQTALLWNLGTRMLTRTFAVQGGFIQEVAFSPDGTRLTMDSYPPGTVQLWNLAAAKTAQATTFTGIESAFSPNGSVLVVDGVTQLALWDLTTGKQFASLPVFSTSEPQLIGGPMALDHGGTLLAVVTGPDLDQLQLWSLPYLANTTAYLCGLAGEPFPAAAWAQDAPGVPYQKTCP